MNIRRRTIEVTTRSVIGTETGTRTIDLYHAVIRRDVMQAALNATHCHQCGKEITGQYKTINLIIDENDHVYCSLACLSESLDNEYKSWKEATK